MKKALLIIAVIAVLSGCGMTKTETMTCKSRNTMGTISSNTVYKIDYKNNDVKKVTVTYEYNDNKTDGVGTGTDGTTSDDNNRTTNNNTGTTNNNMNNNDGIIGGTVGEALDDIITGVADGILDIAGIKSRHTDRFGTYTTVEGFSSKIDTDKDNDYKVTYTYDFDKLSDNNISLFGLDKNIDNLRTTYTNNGLTCK